MIDNFWYWQQVRNLMCLVPKRRMKRMQGGKSREIETICQRPSWRERAGCQARGRRWKGRACGRGRERTRTLVAETMSGPLLEEDSSQLARGWRGEPGEAGLQAPPLPDPRRRSRCKSALVTSSTHQSHKWCRSGSLWRGAAAPSLFSLILRSDVAPTSVP